MILTLFLSSVLALAGDGNCEDIAKLACSKRTVFDGTGSVRSVDENGIQKKLGDSIEQVLNQKFKDFKRYIASDQGAYLRDLILKTATGEVFKKCEEAPKSKDCNDGLYKTYASAFISRQFWLSGNLSESSNRILNSDFNRQVGFATVAAVEGLPWHQEFVKKSVEEIYQKATNKKSRESIKDLVSSLKKVLLSEIQNMPLEDELKRRMLNKIKSIEFAGTQCSEISSSSGAVSLNGFFSGNAFYHPQRNTIQVCEGRLAISDSLFDLANVVTHELAHAVDPCNVQTLLPTEGALARTKGGTEKATKNPYEKLLLCLQDSADFSTDGEVCDGKDPRLESFADWLAISVVSKHFSNEQKRLRLTPKNFRDGYANMYKAVCQATGDNATEAELRSSDRINNLLIQNPTVIAQIGCEQPQETRWCKVETFQSSKKKAEGGHENNLDTNVGGVK